MYVRISRGRYNLATEDEMVRIAEERLIPAFQKLPGFQRYLGCGSSGSGVVCGISFWDSEAHANFSRDGLMSIYSALAATGVELEPPEIYEVTTDV